MHAQVFTERRHRPRHRPASTINILLVEDCKSDVYLMNRMLEQVAVSYTFIITDVPRLVDAFTRLNERPFDLIMLDLNLLDIDGTASIAALHAEAPHTPIIIYSGMDDRKLKEEALQCGAAHYLVKGQVSSYGL